MDEVAEVWFAVVPVDVGHLNKWLSVYKYDIVQIVLEKRESFDIKMKNVIQWTWFGLIESNLEFHFHPVNQFYCFLNSVINAK